MKEKLITAIIDLVGDELTKEEQNALQTESYDQLIDRIISIANWYATQYHEIR